MSRTTTDQFSLRFLFGLTTGCSLAIVGCRLAWLYTPWLFGVAFILALISASLGGWFLLMTALVSLAVYFSPQDKDRPENLRRCWRLLVFGVLSLLPAGTLLLIVLTIR